MFWSVMRPAREFPILNGSGTRGRGGRDGMMGYGGGVTDGAVSSDRMNDDRAGGHTTMKSEWKKLVRTVSRNDGSGM